MTGKRLTVQKLKILDYLHSVKTHPNAEEVFEAVKKDIPTISLATVYRNLNQLSTEGTILKLEVGGEFRFDGDVSKHQHCYCSTCGKVVDVFSKKINDYALKHFESDEFEVSNVHVLFKGVCKKCT